MAFVTSVLLFIKFVDQKQLLYLYPCTNALRNASRPIFYTYYTFRRRKTTKCGYLASPKLFFDDLSSNIVVTAAADDDDDDEDDDVVHLPLLVRLG